MSGIGLLRHLSRWFFPISVEESEVARGHAFLRCFKSMKQGPISVIRSLLRSTAEDQETTSELEALWVPASLGPRSISPSVRCTSGNRYSECRAYLNRQHPRLIFTDRVRFRRILLFANAEVEISLVV